MSVTLFSILMAVFLLVFWVNKMPSTLTYIIYLPIDLGLGANVGKQMHLTLILGVYISATQGQESKLVFSNRRLSDQNNPASPAETPRPVDLHWLLKLT